MKGYLDDSQYQGNEVRLCNDGKYRWIYEMNMITNPTIFLTVYKIFFYIILVGFALFGTFLYGIHGDWAGLWDMAKGALIALVGFAVLTFLGVLLVSFIHGGKYVVLFEMDENEIAHIQMPRQVEKSELIGLLTALVGAAAKSPTAMGAGMLAAANNRSTSIFSKVRRIKAYRRRDLIKVNQRLFRNQVYVYDKDFDFVYDFIKKHCTNAKY